jgi:hypothetical protein
MLHILNNINNIRTKHMSEQLAMEQTAKAGLPAAGLKQAGFADLLGVGDEKSVVIGKPNKKGTSVRYCLLPATGKGRSIKSEMGCSGSQAKKIAALELHKFSTRVSAGIVGLLTSGQKLAASVVEKDNGTLYIKLVDNRSAVVEVEKPVDLAAVEKYLAEHPEDARLLLASK